MRWALSWPGWSSGPGFAFVEAHGGYSALLHHQRSYLGAWSDWGSHRQAQVAQGSALSGGLALIVPTWIVATSSAMIAPGAAWRVVMESRSIMARAGILLSLGAAGWCLSQVGDLVVVLVLPWLLGLPGRQSTELFGPPRTSTRVVGVWWVSLMVLTPLYHPYARLWLPCHAVQWLLGGWLVGEGLPRIACRFARSPNAVGPPRIRSAWVSTLVLGLVAIVVGLAVMPAPVMRLPGLLDPTDALYQATVQVSAQLPEEVQGLRLLVRPPVTFYLSGRVALFPMAGSAALSEPGDSRVWALVDSAILRSESGWISGGSGRDLLYHFAADWEIVGEFPTWPSLPTLLDIDPGAARAGSTSDRTYPLWLLRPRTAKARR